MKLPHRDAVAFEWSMMLMRRAFRDLAVSFAAVDPALADQAIQRCEMMVAREFDLMLKKPTKGVSDANMRGAIALAVAPFREMTQDARHLVQQAGNPKH